MERYSLHAALKRGDKDMYLVFAMIIYFTIRDVQLIKGIFQSRKAKKKLPELQQPKEPEVEDDNR